MRRDVGGHADGDAGAAVDQQVGELGGQNGGFLFAFVVVGLEIDRIPVDVVDQEHGGFGQAGFGVALGGGGIAVHAAEIALAVDQAQANGERLGHADHGVVDRSVAVGVVFAHDVAGDASGFAVGLIRGVAGFLHGEEDAAMHRLQPVARIGQRAADDDGHGVGEIGGLHLLLEHHRGGIGAVRWLGRGGGRVGVTQGRVVP